MQQILLIAVAILSSLQVILTQEPRSPPSKIAIVGAGIGGTSAAYFLRQKFGKDVRIDIFEKGVVGGRLSTVEVDGNHYEAGGSIIHPLNLHMKAFVKDLGLTALSLPKNQLGVYNGDEFVFQESECFLMNIINKVWKYGMNFLRLSMWVEDILEKFMRIYQYQRFDYSFSSMESMFHALGGKDFSSKLNTTLSEAMQNYGFSQKFIDDIVTPTMRINYGQGVEVNSFVGAVSMSCLDPGQWAVEGGNKLVCSRLIDASEAQLIQGSVTSVQENVHITKSGDTVRLYEVRYQTSNGAGQDFYDIIIIATPLNKAISKIEFQGFNPPIETFSKPYIQVVTTVVHGKINASFFGCSKPCHFGVSEIFTTDNPKHFVSSISRISPVTFVPESHLSNSSGYEIWRMFSPELLTDDQLGLLFESYEGVGAKKWLAYPQYTNAPEKLPPIMLHHGIYYVNSIEWAASAMEICAVSAKNVALLSYHRWYDMDTHVDQDDLAERLKSEL
ncbi:prenylcysteine oxidase 1-like [Rhinoderma darwinii]|uniref:prenylcysteine oxidase 1-like n=1 Tax=Rhinoderma darwinii TaxID=43563 RepID=UPI003F677CA0